MLLNVLDFSSPAAALSAAQDGDRIYFPSLRTYVAPTGGWQVTKSLELFGDGTGVDSSSGSVLRSPDANSPVLDIVPPITSVYVHDLHLQRGGTGSGTGVGLRCQSGAGNPTLASGIRVRNVRANGFPSHGMLIEGYNGSSARVSNVSLLEVEAAENGGCGVLLRNAYDTQVVASTFRANTRSGLAMDGGNTAVIACTFDANVTDATLDPGDANGQCYCTACEMVDIDGCRFLNMHLGTVHKACVLVDGCGHVGNCQFDSDEPEETSYGVVLDATSDAGPFIVLGNRFRNVVKMLTVGSGVVGAYCYPQYEESYVGEIDAPGGLLGTPTLIRLSETQIGGLQVPVLSGDPSTTRPVPGMLAYNASLSLPVRVYDGRAWRSVVLVDPPS